MKKILLSLLAVVAIANFSYGQIAVKTNLLPWAGGMGNLGIEVGVAPHWTVSATGSAGSIWGYDDFRADGGMGNLELRYYTCRAFNGHHFGLYGGYGDFDRVIDNVGFMNFGSGVSSDEYWRRDVKGWTAGLSYGYMFKLNSHWGIDAFVGFGYVSLDYTNQHRTDLNRDPNANEWPEDWATADPNDTNEYDKSKPTHSKDFWYPSKLGISLSYKF